MSTPTEPNWELLPRNPVGFFELQEGFDRRDLKRRYNQLIRQFKPEKHPAEFQKIRAAYEALDVSLRYGGTGASQQIPAEAYQWVTDVSPRRTQTGKVEQTVAGDRATTGGVSTLPLHDRVRSESVKGIYQELVEKKGKSAFDYYALAVMSDLVEPGDKLKFASWLLKGLAAHKSDLGLLHLLHSYLHGPIPHGTARKLVIACSQTVPEHSFFQITEPLWQALLREENFSVFRETYARCEANLSGMSIDGKIIFTIYIFKHALWKADTAWIDEQMAFVDENFERIPPFMEYDMELVCTLHAYITSRKYFLNGKPLTGKLDAALRDYFTEDPIQGDRSVLECQSLIMQDFDFVSDAFPELGNPHYEPFYNLWSWISHDVAERYSDLRETDEQLWMLQLPKMMQEIKVPIESFLLGIKWCVSALVFTIGSMLCFALPFYGYQMTKSLRRGLSDGSSELIALGGAMAATIGVVSSLIYLGIMLHGQMNRRIIEPLELRTCERLYRRHWRALALGFLTTSHVPFHTFVSSVDSVVKERHSLKYYFHQFLQQDFALAIYATSLRFVV